MAEKITTDWISATKCYNAKGNQEKEAWFVPYGKKACKRIEDIASEDIVNNQVTADNVVFSIQMPLRKKKTFDEMFVLCEGLPYFKSPLIFV